MNDAAAHLGRVLSIAGSDCSGGAGIQADVKTITALGGYAATAITALTVQDTSRVHAVHAVAPDLVRRQMDAVMADIGADALKTGMLHSAAIIDAVADVIAGYDSPPPLVVDPVMVATSGDRLLERAAEQALITNLLPLALIATPNLREAAVLADRPVKTAADMRDAARALAASGPQCVLVTGGDLDGDVVVDVLVTPTELRTFTSPRIATASTHGTGCTLASAIATLLAQGRDVVAAVDAARDYVHMAITHAPGFGGGAGPLDHGWPLRDLP